MEWGPNCKIVCLLSRATPPVSSSLSYLELSRVSSEYHNLKEDSSLDAGIIHPSSSPAGAGFFFVGKQHGNFRLCIDYHNLSKRSVRNLYPLPLMSSAFELLQGPTIFPKLDLRNLVRIREGDEWNMAFNTHTGHYEYLVMPFGLTNALAIFQALIKNMILDMLNQCVFIYLDDIDIFQISSQAWPPHQTCSAGTV